MAHIPTVVEMLENLEVVKHASATWNVAISITYKDGALKRRGQWFSLDALTRLTNEEVMHEVMAGIGGAIVP